MVQERVIPKSEDDMTGLEIVDVTSPTVDAKIAVEEKAAGVTPPETVTDAPSPEQVEPLADVTPAPAPQPQAQQPVTPVAQPKPPRTFSEDEWNKRQSAIDRQLAEERRQRQALEARMAELDLNSQVEAYRQAEEQRLSQTYEPAAARQQATINAEARRAKLLSDRETQRAQATQMEAANLVKLAAADRIRQDFGLEQDDIDHLMSARSLDHMIAMARRLASTSQAQQQAKAEAKARVPNGQRAESPVSPGRGALTPDELTEIYNSGDDTNPRYNDAAAYVAGLMRRRR